MEKEKINWSDLSVEERFTKLNSLFVGTANKDINVADEIPSDFKVYNSLEDLAVLSEDEAVVFALYYGLNGENPRTFKAIGNLFGKTSIRMEQIFGKALTKLIVKFISVFETKKPLAKADYGSSLADLIETYKTLHHLPEDDDDMEIVMDDFDDAIDNDDVDDDISDEDMKKIEDALKPRR